MSLDLYASRVREQLAGDPRITEKRAFGGHMFLLNGNMLISVKKDGRALVHVGKDDNDAALAREGASQMEHRGKLVTGFVWVEAYATENEDDLADWVQFAAASAAKLPPK